MDEVDEGHGRVALDRREFDEGIVNGIEMEGVPWWKRVG